MKWLKRFFIAALIIFGAASLHYNLPSRDIVQIAGTDVKRMDIDRKAWFWGRPDAGTNISSTRDVRFINAAWPNGKPRVYRNEDTDWGWPPYFKFDSGNLNAEAQTLAKEDDVWVAVSHYGWRIKILSIFPNAYKIKRVAGPDTLLIPWFNIVFLSILAIIILRIFFFARGVKRKHVDPVTDKIDKQIDDAAETAQREISEGRSAISKFFRKWFGSSK